MLHLEVLRAFKRERLTLKLAVRADRDFNVFGKLIIQCQAMFAHNCPVSVAVIINLNFKNLISEIVENYHIIKL